jgi:hypothetical protein
MCCRVISRALSRQRSRSRCKVQSDGRRYPEAVRLSVLVAAALLTGCASKPAAPSTADPTQEPWYRQTVEQLAALDRDAEAAFENHKPDQAAALIEKAQPLRKRVLDVRQPTLAAAEAASDLYDLYGRMLLSNRHYEWAEILFQQNRSRWKNWGQKSPETDRRLKQAEAAIQECDRYIAQ